MVPLTAWLLSVEDSDAETDQVHSMVSPASPDCEVGSTVLSTSQVWVRSRVPSAVTDTETTGTVEIAPTASMSAPTLSPVVPSALGSSVSRTNEKAFVGNVNASRSTPLVPPATLPTAYHVVPSSDTSTKVSSTCGPISKIQRSFAVVPSGVSTLSVNSSVILPPHPSETNSGTQIGPPLVKSGGPKAPSTF